MLLYMSWHASVVWRVSCGIYCTTSSFNGAACCSRKFEYGIQCTWFLWKLSSLALQQMLPVLVLSWQWFEGVWRSNLRLEIWKYLSVTSNEWSFMRQMRVYPHPEFRETNCLSCAKIKYGNYYFLRPIQLTLCIIDIEPVEELDGDVCWSNFGMENWVIALWTIAFCT